MRNLMYALLLISITHFMALPNAVAADLSLEEVIAKNLEAKGGEEALRAVQTIKIQAKISSQGFEIPITMYIKHDYGFRMNMSVMGQTGFNIVRKDAAWIYFPFQQMTEPKVLSKQEFEPSLYQLEAQDAFIDYETKGHYFELIGLENINDRECYKILGVLRGGNQVEYYIDTETFQVIRDVISVTINSNEVQQISNFSDFKETSGGLIKAHTVKQNIGEFTIETMEVNIDVPNSMFEPTVEKEKEPAEGEEK